MILIDLFDPKIRIPHPKNKTVYPLLTLSLSDALLKSRSDRKLRGKVSASTTQYIQIR